jgi:hypothetical protein
MEMLNELVTKWKENSQYTDVEAVFMNSPSNKQMDETCPVGCSLANYESERGGSRWREMEEYPDYFRQTRICREHGYARIYVTTGLIAMGFGYSLE